MTSSSNHFVFDVLKKLSREVMKLNMAAKVWKLLKNEVITLAVFRFTFNHLLQISILINLKIKMVTFTSKWKEISKKWCDLDSNQFRQIILTVYRCPMVNLYNRESSLVKRIWRIQTGTNKYEIREHPALKWNRTTFLLKFLGDTCHFPSSDPKTRCGYYQNC